MIVRQRRQLRINGGVSLSNFHRRPANGENYSRKFLQKRSVGGIYSEKFLQKRSVGGIYSEKFLQKRSVGGIYSEKRLQKRSVGGIYSGKRLQKRSVGGIYLRGTPSKEVGWRNLLWGSTRREASLPPERTCMGYKYSRLSLPMLKSRSTMLRSGRKPCLRPKTW